MEVQNCFLLSILWIAYCVVHSLLVSTAVTGFFRGILKGHYRFYRLFFNLFSVGTLIPLVIFSQADRFRGEMLFIWEGPMRLVQFGMIALATFLVISCLRSYSMLQFLGIRQILQERSGSGMADNGELDSRVVLGVSRHPWYLAAFILLWARDLTLTAIIISLILSGYLVIGTFLEERKMILEFGDKYKEYRRHVSMFIPFKWLQSKFRSKILSKDSIVSSAVERVKKKLAENS